MINSALCSWNSKHTPEALGDGLELAKRRSEVHLILLLLGCVTLLATRPSHALSFGPSPDRSGWQGCGVLRVWSWTTPNRLRDEENVLANWEGTAENRRPKGRQTGSGSLTWEDKRKRRQINHFPKKEPSLISSGAQGWGLRHTSLFLQKFPEMGLQQPHTDPCSCSQKNIALKKKKRMIGLILFQSLIWSKKGGWKELEGRLLFLYYHFFLTCLWLSC